MPAGEVGVVNTVDVAGPILRPVIRTLSWVAGTIVSHYRFW